MIMQRALFMRVASFEECLIIRSLNFNSIVKIYQYHPGNVLPLKLKQTKRAQAFVR